jgi:DNA-binding FadR family transcriptional regulator
VTSTFDRVLDELGTAIVDRTLPTGTVRSIDELVARTGASRSIVREAVRVLVGLGLTDARRRVGVTVRPAADWDVTDPLVIGWRLDGPERQRALAELRALRRALEPHAAAVAAERWSDPEAAAGREALLAAADRLASASVAGPATWAEADRALHRAVLDLSGNAVFVRLGRVVDRVLDERAAIGPDALDVALHGEVARAVADGDADTASRAMTEIVSRT